MSGRHVPRAVRFLVDFSLAVPPLVAYACLTLYLGTTWRWSLRSFESFPLAALVTTPLYLLLRAGLAAFQRRLLDELDEVFLAVEPVDEEAPCPPS